MEKSKVMEVLRDTKFLVNTLIHTWAVALNTYVMVLYMNGRIPGIEGFIWAAIAIIVSVIIIVEPFFRLRRKVKEQWKN